MKSRKNMMMTAVASAMMLTLTVPSAMAATTTTAAPAKAITVVNFKGAADSYLKQNAAKFQLKSDLSDLQYVSTTTTMAGTYVRYQQTVNGSELFSHQVTVTLNPAGQGVLVLSDYVPNLKVESASIKISENSAEAAAIQHVKAKNLKA
ncbi:MAG: M36 family metallopeptidase, partial [Tumebacillaceae bacterium]